jgi:hypothetical protein
MPPFEDKALQRAVAMLMEAHHIARGRQKETISLPEFMWHM